MSLPIPTVGQEPGPQYASDVNNSFTIIDGHTHNPGSGVQVTTSGLNINADLSINNNNLTAVRSVRFQSQGSPIGGAQDLNCAYVAGVDLWYNDGNGNQIQLTLNGSIAGTAGSISGLVPPASASYNSGSGTFIWQSAVNTPANMDFASAIFRNMTSGSNGVTVSAPSALGSNYSLVWPTIPGTTNFVSLDTSGNFAAVWNVDNTTINFTGNNIQVKPAGITATQIANDAVTTPAILNGAVTAPKTGFNIDLAATIFTTGGTFIVPANVTNIAVLGAGGGGGAGGGNSGNPNNRGGGGGGAGVQPILTTTSVSPGETLTIVIGAGGAGGGVNGGNGGNGGSSTITGSTSGLLLTFYGGNGGGGGLASAAPNGGIGPNINSFNISGASGALNADPMATDGFSSIYASSFGNHGTGGDSGGGGGAGFGAGGAGGNTGTTGNPGGISAGGGGGGGTNVGGGIAGGAGGSGIIIIYIPTPV